MPIRDAAALDLARKIVLATTGDDCDLLIRLVATLIVIDVAADETAQVLEKKIEEFS